ncbi:glycosyltransferase family 2 protein [Inquilinus sp. YAF38]|uniref:glycosyltransferase family 2 protein n=1 Tax=Inquilinus sp. YAF38 TaxID=3233084 RepID=UPI003F919D71
MVEDDDARLRLFSRGIALEDLTRVTLWTIACDLPTIDDTDYRAWIAAHSVLSQADQHQIVGRLRTLFHKPLISLILTDAGHDGVHATLASIADQIYQNIEVIIVARSSRIDAMRSLSSKTARPNQRCIFAIVPDDAPAVDAENTGLAAATGVFVAFLSSGDRLATEALASMIFAINRQPKTVAVYSDEDWIDADGSRLKPRFKTAWDPDAHLMFDLMGRLCLMRRDLVNYVGGLRPDRVPADHYDLHGRLAAVAGQSRILHVPEVLYHRCIPPAGDPDVEAEALAAYAKAARRIAADHARRMDGEIVEVQPSPLAPYLNRIVRSLPDPAPLVSVLVPTRDKAELLHNCARGLLEKTDYPSVELLILDNGSVEAETHSLFKTLQRDPRVRILPMAGPFNYSKINNDGVAAARGEVVAFLNNDIEVIDQEWLREMVSLAMQPEIGGVGAKLLYSDLRIQHAGIVLAPGPLAAHAYRRRYASDPGYEGQIAGVRGYLAVTAACLVTRKAVFEEVGGFDETSLRIAFNDVDLCLRMNDFGYKVVCTPFAKLLHLESASRGYNRTSEQIDRERSELATMAARWSDRFRSDPFHNPNTLHRWDEGLGIVAPRQGRSWLPRLA